MIIGILALYQYQQAFELIARRLFIQYSAFFIAPSVDEAESWSQRGTGGRLAAAVGEKWSGIFASCAVLSG